MELGPMSSHDAEPMSLTSLSPARRALTAPEPFQPQSSAQSLDELALPFPFEIAIPRYPSLWPNGSCTATQEIKSSYVGTGSPWKVPDDPTMATANLEDRTRGGLVGDDGFDGGCTIELGSNNAPGEDYADPDPISTIDEVSNHIVVPPQEGFMDCIKVLSKVAAGSCEIAFPMVQKEDFTEPTDSKEHQETPPAREASSVELHGRNTKDPKKRQKKKLKRGKTTSAVLRRAVDSDIEEDVIWIDEKRTTNETTATPTTVIDDTDASEDAFAFNDADEKSDTFYIKVKSVDVSPQAIGSEPLTLPTPTSDLAEMTIPAPKKRGRKRKRTDQQEIVAQEPTALSEEPNTGHTAIKSRTNSGPLVLSEPAVLRQQHNENDRTSEPDDGGIQPKSVELKTPKKQTAKGPDKHSPISTKAAYRVGLSRKARIAPLLRVIRK